MSKKDKLAFSNFCEIVNFIQSATSVLSFADVVNFCVDYQNHKELCYYYPIIYRLLIEKNLSLKK